MKRERSLHQELESYGLADGSRVSDLEEASIDLETEYEAKLWRFAPNKRLDFRHRYPEASLLGIPVELRLQILQYLLPDRDGYGVRNLTTRCRPHATIKLLRDAKQGKWHGVPIRKREERLEEYEEVVEVDYAALRNDLEPCYPAVMRVNHQLYTESAQIVHTNKVFTAVLVLDQFLICSREFEVGFQLCDFSMLESQMRHIGHLRIIVDASEEFCSRRHSAAHDCNQLGCCRKRMDGIRNLAEFFSQCVGLHSLEILLNSVEFDKATHRRPVIKKELRSVETKIIDFAKPFAAIRGLAWAEFTINGEQARNHPNSRTEFCNQIDAMAKRMRSSESAPARTDLPLIKCAFHSIFTTNLEYRNVMKQQLELDVDDLRDKCWQACERGDKTKVLQHHKQLTQAWEEQKRIIDGLMRQIEEMASDGVPKREKKKTVARKATASKA